MAKAKAKRKEVRVNSILNPLTQRKISVPIAFAMMSIISEVWVFCVAEP